MPAPEFVTRLPKPADFLPESTVLDGEKQAGVYLLLKQGEVVYVGQSSHMLLRLTQHRAEGKKCFNKTLVYHMPASEESERLWVEGAMICAYRPAENRAWHVGFSDGKCWEIGFGRKRRKK